MDILSSIDYTFFGLHLLSKLCSKWTKYFFYSRTLFTYCYIDLKTKKADKNGLKKAIYVTKLHESQKSVLYFAGLFIIKLSLSIPCGNYYVYNDDLRLLLFYERYFLSVLLLHLNLGHVLSQGIETNCRQKKLKKKKLLLNC